MDPFTQGAAVLGLFDKIARYLPGRNPPPKFGQGDPDKEREHCRLGIHVYLRTLSHARYEERTRFYLDRDTTLRKTLENRFTPETQKIMDENEFRLEGSILDRPLWQFSNRCALNLEIVHESALQEVYDTHLKPSTQWIPSFDVSRLNPFGSSSTPPSPSPPSQSPPPPPPPSPTIDEQ
eukprot:TRINITY_DN7050_c0_g1_i1.p1 TRINITY_DN7050_c0_g1~~TRINITY_DN7050_c0_g1_i1.p1  ORF type:complete len:179 (+),score=56.45 TRINITY_DN7050_c0_g1_i1:150-686(+)